MIIWINGPFGVGKSQTSYELQRRLTDAFLFDPERVGFFLRKFLPKGDDGDFQYHPLWRKQVRENLLFCAEKHPLVIVPMTIVDETIFDYIIGGLRTAGVELHHYSLLASKATITKRIEHRGDRSGWAIGQIDRCLAALQTEKFGTHIDNEQYRMDEVVELIANELNLSLDKPRLTGLAKKIRWFQVYKAQFKKL